MVDLIIPALVVFFILIILYTITYYSVIKHIKNNYKKLYKELNPTDVPILFMTITPLGTGIYFSAMLTNKLMLDEIIKKKNNNL